MITLIITQFATRLARFGNEVRETWRETQRLRRALAGPIVLVAERAFTRPGDFVPLQYRCTI